MSSSEIFSFTIPGHTSQRAWCVYIIVIIPNNLAPKLYYVGKVGDNRAGCNPIISRIGNHLSFNKIHGQLRNKLGTTTDNCYEIHYVTLGEYSITDKDSTDKINELERQLNKRVQQKTVQIINPYHGKGHITKLEKEYRKKMITKKDELLLNSLIEKVFKLD